MDDPSSRLSVASQAERAAEALGDEHFDGFYVSPLHAGPGDRRADRQARSGFEPEVQSWLQRAPTPRRCRARPRRRLPGVLPEPPGHANLEHWWDGMEGRRVLPPHA